jgi:hypothetical protein
MRRGGISHLVKVEGDIVSMWGCSSETHQGLEAVVIGRHRRQVHDLRRGRGSESAVEAKCEAVANDSSAMDAYIGRGMTIKPENGHR